MDAISTTTTTTTPAPAGASANANANGQAKVGPIQYADLPIDIMRAALTCASKEETRYYLRGIFIRARGDNLLDIVASDGVRMFVATADHQHDTMPGWAAEGIILPAEDLALLLPVIDKLTGDTIPQRLVRVGFGVEAPHATVSTWDGKATFKVRPIDGDFPDYVRVIGQAGAAAGTPGQCRTASVVQAQTLRLRVLQHPRPPATSCGNLNASCPNFLRLARPPPSRDFAAG